MSATVTHAIVTADGAQPNRTMLFLHGIFGTGGNWRTFARRFVAARPEWAAVLVDLRMHGASQGFAPPHTVATTAADLDALDAVLPYPVRGVVGHSFGGKVALAYIDRHARNLSEAWILDSMPGTREHARGSESTMRALEVMAALPNEPFPSRNAFVQKLVDEGIARSVAQWLAMNLRAEARGVYRLRLDLAANRSQIEDYFALDLWRVIERAPDNLALHIVIGGQSGVFDANDRARVERLANERPQHLYVHVLEKAGHWVHVDDPDGLFAVMTAKY
jgi:pimeloyl-ACP methyl ester carboxylesterase